MPLLGFTVLMLQLFERSSVIVKERGEQEHIFDWRMRLCFDYCCCFISLRYAVRKLDCVAVVDFPNNRGRVVGEKVSPLLAWIMLMSDSASAVRANKASVGSFIFCSIVWSCEGTMQEVYVVETCGGHGREVGLFHRVVQRFRYTEKKLSSSLASKRLLQDV